MLPSYVAILVPDREAGGYAVLFPDLPGCVTQGEDVAEAYEMAVEALAGHLATMEEYGDTIPAPRSFEDIRADKTIAKEHEFKWEDVVSMPVFVRPPHGKPERINVSLDSNRLRAIDAYAERRGMTRSAVLEAGADMLITQDPVKIVHTKVGAVVLGNIVKGKVVRPSSSTSRLAADPRRQPQDRNMINVNEDHEVRDWAKRLGVSERQLKAAVKKVGTKPKAVARALGKTP